MTRQSDRTANLKHCRGGESEKWKWKMREWKMNDQNCSGWKMQEWKCRHDSARGGKWRSKNTRETLVQRS